MAFLLFFEITIFSLKPKTIKGNIIGNFRDQGSEFNHGTAQVYWLGKRSVLF